jgi:ankyrin repeat protein
MATLFDYVKQGDHEGCVRILDTGLTSLHFACIECDEICVKLLLDRCANPNSIDNANATPLYLAIFYGNMNYIKLLLEYGTEPTEDDRDLASY